MRSLGVSEVPSRIWRGRLVDGSRTLVQEVPIGFVYDGGTEAVMMATPDNLEDFAIGFSLSERIIASLEEVEGLDVVTVARGVELRMTLSVGRREQLITRRRVRAGPAGCGLCGIESIAEALPGLPVLTSTLTVGAQQIIGAMEALVPLQTLNAQTRSAHAAAFFLPGEGVIAVREDVGRHNALDKLGGALGRTGRSAASGVVLMTSRVSVELVQKVAVMGSPIIAAVSAPTSLAVEEAERAGVTIVGIVRRDGLEVFSRKERVIDAT
ncbi:MAG: formate dehydrogenase accessory sulfurtransferase FdhD [Micropepsaceae bacterium]